MTVVAPAGVGKTRLTVELAEWLRGDARVLTGSCLPYGDGITFWPIAEVVRQAAALDADDPHDVAREQARAASCSMKNDAELVCAQLEPLLGLSSRGRLDRGDLLGGAHASSRRSPSRARLLLVLDDLHWAEEALLDLIDYLVSRAGGAPLLLVCGTRPDLLERRTPLGGRGANAATLALEPLGAYVSAELMRLQLGGGDLPRDLAKRILETAAGNPLFIQELVRMLVEDGVVVQRDGAWRVTADVRELAMPATIHGLLAARLDQLDNGDRDAAQRAAVIGHVFSAAAVRELCDEPARPALADALERLERRKLIAQEAGRLAGGDAFRFSHVLVRDAAYAGLVKSKRAELHERLRDVARERAQRKRTGARRDPRLPLRAGCPVPARARRRPRRRAGRRAGVGTTRRGRAPGACLRRRSRGAPTCSAGPPKSWRRTTRSGPASASRRLRR